MRYFLLLTLFATALAQNTNTYLGPREPIPGNPRLVRVQVLVNDDANPNGVQILKAQFNERNIPLKPRSDVYGFRGQASFQTPPGTYKLKWTVKLDATAWPREVSHEEEVIIDKKDDWIQITITGEKAEIS